MAIINRPPLGFLSWLDSKTLGDSPNTYSASVAPTVDLEKFYSAAIPVQVATISSAVTSANQDTVVATISVPNTEAWLIEAATGTFVATAPNVVGRVQIRQSTNNQLFRLPMLFSGFPLAGLTAGVSFDSAVPYRDWIAPPGTVFQAFLAIANGNGNAAMTFAYRRLVV